MKNTYVFSFLFMIALALWALGFLGSVAFTALITILTVATLITFQKEESMGKEFVEYEKIRLEKAVRAGKFSAAIKKIDSMRLEIQKIRTSNHSRFYVLD